MTGREDMLRRIRTALGAGADPGRDARAGPSASAVAAGIPRAYGTTGRAGGGETALQDLLVQRLLDYKAGVRRVAAAEVGAAVAGALATGLFRREPPAAHGPLGARPLRVLIPPGLPDYLLTGIDGDVVVDAALSTAELDAMDAVVTAATVAVAETGTIVLDGSPDQGRRAITLVPDVHICVVRAEQIVADVPDAMPHLDPSRPLTWISGPSATSDIELDRVEGVHGPRILEVVLVV